MGFATVYLAYRALRLIDEPALELTILALVTVTYSLAAALHVSGPLGVVVAGLLTGHRSTRFAMTDLSREQVILFWDMMDELLNPPFLLMGFALLSVAIGVHLLIAPVSGIALAVVNPADQRGDPNHLGASAAAAEASRYRRADVGRLARCDLRCAGPDT